MTEILAPSKAQQITATIVFADLVGFDRLSAVSGTERAYLAVTHVLRQLDTVARQYDREPLRGPLGRGDLCRCHE
jgi:class 3 adenylate cyclase